MRKDLLQVSDRNSGPLATMPDTAKGHDYESLTEYLKRVKAKFPEKTEATVLLEPDTPYDTVVQVMDHVRVFEQGEGGNIVQAELFPDISMGDAPVTEAAGAAHGPRSPPHERLQPRSVQQHHLRNARSRS